MTVGGALLVYAAVLGLFGSRAARRDGWCAYAPRLGASLLLAASWSVLTALFLAGLTIALPGTALSSGLSSVLGACILRLRAAYVTPGGAAAAVAGLALSGTIAARVGWAFVHVVRTRHVEQRRQRTLLGLCGRQTADVDAVVVDEAQPAAYCVAGRDRMVVLTSGTLALLSPSQLAAVLAHEHAHLGARHHRLLAAAALAACAMPELPLLRELPRQVRRLLEMHADDVAARTHDPETLATALVAVATARSGAPSTGTRSVVLAAADSDTALRIQRLLLPPLPVSPRRKRKVRLAVAALGLLPLLVALAPAVVAVNQPPVQRGSAVQVETSSPSHTLPGQLG
jgi:Zn-dependent protease with chaperone function